MTRLIFLVMMILPLAGFCQEEKSQRRLSAIGIIFAPEYNYRSLNYSSSNRWVEEMRDAEEVGNISFTSGVQLHFRLRDKLKLETGVLYSNKSLRTKSESLMWTSDDPGLPSRSKTIYRYKYLSVPVNVTYTFLEDEKIKLFVTTGLSANIFLARKTKVVMTYPDGEESDHSSSKLTGYLKLNLSAMIGAGMDYHLSKRFTVRAEPFYQRSLTSIVADNEAKEFLYSFGVATGVYYSF